MRAIRHFLHRNRARWLLATLLVALLLPSGASAVIAGPMEPRADMPQEAAARAAYGGLPLAFEANEGQGDPSVRFLARGHGYTLALAPDALALGLPAPLRFTFPGANPDPMMHAEQPLPGVVNSFIGNDPTRWQVGIPTSTRVRYTDLYPGLDLVVYGTAGGGWEYDVIVAPGADPAVFSLSIGGATGVALDAATGDLVLTTAGEARQHAPTIYQEVDGARRAVAGGYALRDDGTVGFRIGAYDPALPLVIDPTFVYGTYLGGSGSGSNGNDQGNGIAVDTGGNAYVTGSTTSADFPGTPPQGYHGSGDAFATKFNTNGTMIYSTYLGGSAGDSGTGIAVDTSGNAYVTGSTQSYDFPVNSIAPRSGGVEAFVVKLGTAGQVIYGTYLGGSADDSGSAIAVDAGGDAYVTGSTGSANFPVTNGSTYDDGGGDAFVTKLSANGTRIYSTYLGGSGADGGDGIAIDTHGNAYVIGNTGSSDFPVTDGSTLGGGLTGDAFVAKLDGSGTRVYSLYLGGNDSDAGYGIAVDTNGNAYATGITYSTNFPITDGSTISRNGDAFVTKLNGSGARLYSTILGRGGDSGDAIAVDANGNAYVTGGASANFPVTDGSTFGGGGDAFAAKLNTSGGHIYATYIGGSGSDAGYGIAVDTSGGVYITGITASTNFPVTNHSTFGGGGYDAFVAKIVVTSSPPPAPNPLPPPQPGPAPSGQPAALPQARPTVPVISAPNPLPARRP